MRRPSPWETGYGCNEGSSAQETRSVSPLCPGLGGRRGRGAKGGDGREGGEGMGWGGMGWERGSGGDGTRPPGASFLLAAAFKEAPGLRWTGAEGGARPPGSARRVALRSAPLAGAAGARRGCDAAVVFVGSRGRGCGGSEAAHGAGVRLAGGVALPAPAPFRRFVSANTSAPHLHGEEEGSAPRTIMGTRALPPGPPQRWVGAAAGPQVPRGEEAKSERAGGLTAARRCLKSGAPP